MLAHVRLPDAWHSHSRQGTVHRRPGPPYYSLVGLASPRYGTTFPRGQYRSCCGQGCSLARAALAAAALPAAADKLRPRLLPQSCSYLSNGSPFVPVTWINSCSGGSLQYTTNATPLSPTSWSRSRHGKLTINWLTHTSATTYSGSR